MMKTNKFMRGCFLLVALPTLFGCAGDKSPSKSEETIDNNDKASFSLNVDSLELSVGDTFSLYPPTHLSDEGLSWLSSDPSIVFVDDEGELEARDLGSVVVYAFDSRAIASVNVVVSASASKFSLELSSYSLTLGKGDEYSCRVLARFLENGKEVQGKSIDVEKKEESVEGVASFEKDGDAYRFTGLKVGTAVYSFSVLAEGRRIGKNLAIKVIEMN